MIRETQSDLIDGQALKIVTYGLGPDEISQTTTTFENGVPSNARTDHFLHDGHGSVRALLDAAAAILTLADTETLQLFAYDAYGVALGFAESSAGTSVLNNGEQFDQHVMMQYLRARWYQPEIGRFGQFDPFTGNLSSPLTLNKYAYTSGDPIRFSDPSGMFECLISLLSSINISGMNRGQSVAGSLRVLQTAQKAANTIETIQKFANILFDVSSGDVVGIVQSLVGIDPAEIKDIVGKLLSSGLTTLGATALAAGPPVYLNIDLPKTGQIGKALRVVSNVLGKSNRVQEYIGEVAAYLLASLMSFENADLPNFPTVAGPDIFAKHKNFGVWAMIEAKGGRGKLATGASYGDEMQWRWINHWYGQLASDNRYEPGDGSALYDDYNAVGLPAFPGGATARPIVAMVASLNLARAKDQLRLGIQVWTKNNLQWNQWPNTGPNGF